MFNREHSEFKKELAQRSQRSQRNPLRFPSVLSVFSVLSVVNLFSHTVVAQANQPAPMNFDIKQIERDRGVIKQADQFLSEQPIPITASKNPRSAGGLHDFSSEGDYWWPDPANPDGPYIQKDGMTNPDNFVAHRHAMIRMSIQVAALTSAYRITGEEKYAQQAIKHLRAWFVDPQTIMNPNLQYAQAIKGVSTGRGIGVIDTVHLMEPAR